MKSWSSLSGAVNFWLIAESGPAPCCTDHWVKLQKVLPWLGLPKLHCAGFILLGWWSATNVCHSDLIFRLLLWSWRTTETPLRIICLPIMQHSRHPCSSGMLFSDSVLGCNWCIISIQQPPIWEDCKYVMLSSLQFPSWVVHSQVKHFVSGLVSGELLVRQLVHSFSMSSFPWVFLFPFCQSFFCLVLVVVCC